MKLSKRLNDLINFVPECQTVADVGTDHGYVPIALVEQGKAKTAIAMDVRKGPLERAAEHIREYGLEDKIETRLSNGLSKLKQGEADTIIIAGMGGELMIRILEAGKEVVTSSKYLILSPHSEIFLVRKYLMEQGYWTEQEMMMTEEGKYYTMMRVVPQEKQQESPPLSPVELKYGRELIRKKDAVFTSYLEERKRIYEHVLKKLEKAQNKGACRRREEILQELELIKQAEGGNNDNV